MTRPERLELPTTWFEGTWSESTKHLTSHAFSIAHCPIKIALNRRKPLILHTYVMFFWTHYRRLGVITQTQSYMHYPIRSKSECPLYPKADVREPQNHVKLRSAFGQKRPLQSKNRTIAFLSRDKILSYSATAPNNSTDMFFRHSLKGRVVPNPRDNTKLPCNSMTARSALASAILSGISASIITPFKLSISALNMLFISLANGP